MPNNSQDLAPETGSMRRKRLATKIEERLDDVASDRLRAARTVRVGRA